MLKLRLAVASLGLAMLSPAVLQAQAPAAPLPSQILTAKKVFISNAYGDSYQKLWSTGPTQPYNEFYSAIKSLGTYQLVAAPADADLIFQIGFDDRITGVSGSKESGCSSYDSPQVKLTLLDPKTNIVLWVLDEKATVAHMQKGRDQSLQDAIDKLVADLKALTAQPATANSYK